MIPDLPYLRSYPAALQGQARELLAQGQLGSVLQRKYPQAHSVRSDKALYDYVQELKSRYLRNAGTVNKVLFDNKIHVVRHALGLHTAVSRVQGSKLAAKHEIRIASMFKQAPDEFLRMIVVHELAHLREKGTTRLFTSCALTWSRNTTSTSLICACTSRMWRARAHGCGVLSPREFCLGPIVLLLI